MIPYLNETYAARPPTGVRDITPPPED